MRKFRFHLQNSSDYLTFLVWLQIPYQSNSFSTVIRKFHSTNRLTKTAIRQWKSRDLSKLIMTSNHKTNDSKFIYCIITTLYKLVYGSNFPFKTRIDVTKIRFSHVLWRSHLETQLLEEWFSRNLYFSFLHFFLWCICLFHLSSAHIFITLTTNSPFEV